MKKVERDVGRVGVKGGRVLVKERSGRREWREGVKKGSEWKEEGRNQWIDGDLEGEGIGREEDRGMNQGG